MKPTKNIRRTVRCDTNTKNILPLPKFLTSGSIGQYLIKWVAVINCSFNTQAKFGNHQCPKN